MISVAELIRTATKPEKTDRACEVPVGAWNCESSDRIRGCDGACVLAAGFLARAGGKSITNVAALSIFRPSSFSHRVQLSRLNIFPLRQPKRRH